MKNKPVVSAHLKRALDSIDHDVVERGAFHLSLVSPCVTCNKQAPKKYTLGDIMKEAHLVLDSQDAILPRVDFTYDGTFDVEALNMMNAIMDGNAITASVHYSELIGNHAGNRVKAKNDLLGIIKSLKNIIEVLP